MTTATQPYVGYEIRRPAGIPHRGITQDPEQTLAEYRERVGPDVFIQFLTPPLTLREARQWEQFLKQRRHYRPDPANPWGNPHRPVGNKTHSQGAVRRSAFQATGSATAPKRLSSGKVGWTANLPPSSVVPAVRGFGRDYATRSPFRACDSR